MKLFILISACIITISYAYNIDVKNLQASLQSLLDMAPGNHDIKSAGSFITKFQDFIQNNTKVSGSSGLNRKQKHRYIIMLDENIVPQARVKINELIASLSCQVRHKLNLIFDGMTIQTDYQMPDDLLQKIPFIKLVEQDHTLKAYQVQNVDARLWGLDLVDQYTSNPNGKYVFDTTGKGVNIYVIDSGVDVEHPELKGRAQNAYVSNYLNGDPQDCSGHGTHCAGIAAGTNVGIAKEANVFSVRIMGCDQSSTNSALVAAIEWVVANHRKPAILSMSLGPNKAEDGTYPRSQSIDAAVSAARNAGIFVVVAAGNDNSDGCEGSPSGSPGAIVVGAVNSRRQRAWFSNYGKCVSIFAPGDGIYSSTPGGKYGSKWGTSQAAPFVTGVAALYLEKNPNASPEEVLQALRQFAVKDVVGDAKDSDNFFLQSISVPQQGTEGYNRKLVNLFPLPGMSIWEYFAFLSPLIRGVIIASIVLAILIIISAVVFLCRRSKKQKEARKITQASPRPLP